MNLIWSMISASFCTFFLFVSIQRQYNLCYISNNFILPHLHPHSAQSTSQEYKLIQHCINNSMSDQFNFEEINGLEWLKDASQWTDKHPFTLSDVSKEHLFDHFLQQQPENKPNHNHKSITHQREKKNLNAKNYRDKKRNHYEIMKKQIELLQHQNQALKSQKYCKFCKKSFAPNVIYTESSSIRHQQHCQSKQAAFNKSSQMQFQQPDFFTKKRDARTSKLWIALGLVMLVLGLTMWGLDGDKSYISKIELQREQVTKWLEQISEREKHEYMQVNYRIRQENNPKSKNGPSGIQLQFRTPSEGEVEAKEEQISINKDILFSIQAELDDIGLYI